MPYGLSQTELDTIVQTIVQVDNITEAILFGSRAKVTYRNGSDIDLALKGDKLGLQELTTLYVMLDELPLLYKFDLVIFDRITEPALVEHIERVGVILYRK
ncbi:MAG: nucleotidyltransferase domain-containing protein [Paludibacteraceae bacterium]|nr:nucleotidyltransferase domain-containing protein [Paludibacteraceae bacterium]